MKLFDLSKLFSRTKPQAKPETLYIQQAPTQLPLQVLKPKDEIPSIGKRNEKIVASLTLVKRVAVQLGRSGFHVVDVIVSGRNPRIIINPCKRCHMLGGALIKIDRLSQTEVHTMAANIDGVQIEWMVPHA
jgi:hypothetical protein